MFYICFGVSCCRPNRCCYGGTGTNATTNGCGCYGNATTTTNGCGCYGNATTTTNGCGCYGNTTATSNGYGCYANATQRNSCCCSNLAWNGSTFYSASDTASTTDVYTTRACNRCNYY